MNTQDHLNVGLEIEIKENESLRKTSSIEEENLESAVNLLKASSKSNSKSKSNKNKKRNKEKESRDDKEERNSTLEGPKKTYECNRKNSFNRHVLTHSKPKVIKCHICDFECMENKDLKTHMLTHKALFRCSKCTYETDKKIYLKSHMLDASKCDIVSKEEETDDDKTNNFSTNTTATATEGVESPSLMSNSDIIREEVVYTTEKICKVQAKVETVEEESIDSHTSVTISCAELEEGLIQPNYIELVADVNNSPERKAVGNFSNINTVKIGMDPTDNGYYKDVTNIALDELSDVDAKVFQCPECWYEFVDKIHFDHHMLTHIKDRNSVLSASSQFSNEVVENIVEETVMESQPSNESSITSDFEQYDDLQGNDDFFTNVFVRVCEKQSKIVDPYVIDEQGEKGYKCGSCLYKTNDKYHFKRHLLGAF
ncbi:Zinc finger protein [Armadillidium vulgare]|nr:Zinc finger protein [Armadillidium vulgare]